MDNLLFVEVFETLCQVCNQFTNLFFSKWFLLCCSLGQDLGEVLLAEIHHQEESLFLVNDLFESNNVLVFEFCQDFDFLLQLAGSNTLVLLFKFFHGSEHLFLLVESLIHITIGSAPYFLLKFKILHFVK